MKKLLLIIILLLVAATPLLATPTQSTCGDNICRADQNEDKQTCPQDCGKLPESKLIFEKVMVVWGMSGLEVQVNFYYDNQTRTILRDDQIRYENLSYIPGMYCHNANGDSELEKQLLAKNQCDISYPTRSPEQSITDAKCIFEINNNSFEFTRYAVYSRVFQVTVPIVNNGDYSGIVRCISILGNRTWPVSFSLFNSKLYDHTISPEKINEQSIQEINNSVYRDYVNLTQVQQEQKQKEQNKPSSFTEIMSNFMGVALLAIVLFAYSALSVIYAIARTIQYPFNIGKGAKPPIAALAILLSCVLSIAFLPLLILVPVIMTLKIIHKIITAILPKPKTTNTKNKIKIEEI